MSQSQDGFRTTTALERDLEIARQIQSTFLPGSLPQFSGWEIAARFQPARQVAGDFYDAFPMVQNRRIGLVVADVCDKGVPAALFMALYRSLIRAFAQQHYSLNLTDALVEAKPLEKTAGAGGARRALPSIGSNALKNAVTLTNNYIANNHGDTNMFATLFFAVLDPLSGNFNYINAGHNPPLIAGEGGIKTQLEPSGPAIGLLPDMEFEIRQAQLQKGDRLLIYTDGITEARNSAGDLFGEERLLTTLTQAHLSAGEWLDTIYADLCRHIAEADQSDDITMLAIQRLPDSDR
jgi:sigma-B regulation protein RsbU (phosphoserine phosphatase)